MRSATRSIRSASPSHCTVQVYVYSRTHLLPTQIRRAPIQGGSRRPRRAASGHARTSRLLARTPRGALLFCLNHTWRKLAVTLKSASGAGKRPPRSIIQTLSQHRDGRDCPSHDWLRAACRSPPSRADSRTDNVLRLATRTPTDFATGDEWPDASQGRHRAAKFADSTQLWHFGPVQLLGHNNADVPTPVV